MPLQAVGELACRFHAGEAAADDDKVAQPAADRRIGLELDLRDAAQHHVADVHCVADGLERQRILGEAGDRDRAARDCRTRARDAQYGSVISPARVAAVKVLRIGSIALTRPMTKRVRRSICRMGATTCSGKIEAPTASGSIGLNVV